MGAQSGAEVGEAGEGQIPRPRRASDPHPQGSRSSYKVTTDEPGDRRSFLRDHPVLQVENGLGGGVGAGIETSWEEGNARETLVQMRQPQEEGGADGGDALPVVTGRWERGREGDKVTS